MDKVNFLAQLTLCMDAAITYAKGQLKPRKGEWNIWAIDSVHEFGVDVRASQWCNCCSNVKEEQKLRVSWEECWNTLSVT